MSAAWTFSLRRIRPYAQERIRDVSVDHHLLPCIRCALLVPDHPHLCRGRIDRSRRHIHLQLSRRPRRSRITNQHRRYPRLTHHSLGAYPWRARKTVEGVERDQPSRTGIHLIFPTAVVDGSAQCRRAWIWEPVARIRRLCTRFAVPFQPLRHQQVELAPAGQASRRVGQARVVRTHKRAELDYSMNHVGRDESIYASHNTMTISYGLKEDGRT